MGTYDDLQVGQTFVSPPLVVTTEDAAALVRIGGYTHPLFTDASYAATTVFKRPPLPGEAVLHAMGGMVEQTDRFDDTVIALIGFDDVKFRKPAFPEEELRTTIEVLAKVDDDVSGRGTIVMRWSCAVGERPVCEATARMLFQVR